MKEQARDIVRQAESRNQAYNQLGDYLHHIILRALFEEKVLQAWVFHGGTALRILHRFRRYSEDLDFHLRTPDRDPGLELVHQALVRNLERQGYGVSHRLVHHRTVQALWLKFEALLAELGLSDHATEKLHIKVELDTNPPPGYTTTRSMVHRYAPFTLIHHDPPTLLAGKLHAIFQRSYTKGRDWYDVLMLLSSDLADQPNLPYLHNALDQTGYHGTPVTAENWRTLLIHRAETLDWNAVIQDVEPFLELASDVELLQREVVLDSLRQ